MTTAARSSAAYLVEFPDDAWDSGIGLNGRTRSELAEATERAAAIWRETLASRPLRVLKLPHG